MQKLIFIDSGNALMIGRNPEGGSISVCVGELFKDPISIEITTRSELDALILELNNTWSKATEGKAK